MSSKLFHPTIENHSRRLIKWTLFLLTLNIVFAIIDPYSKSKDLSGEIVSGWEVKKSIIITLTIGLAFISLFASLVLSILPFKKLNYSQKYLYFSLFIFFIIQCASCLFEIKNLWFEFIHS